LKREDATMRLERIVANRDMLQRMIHDRTTELTELSQVKEELQKGSVAMIDEYKDVLGQAAAALGEIAWKNEILTSCNDISALARD
jgi:hypothetical protein